MQNNSPIPKYLFHNSQVSPGKEVLQTYHRELLRWAVMQGIKNQVLQKIALTSSGACVLYKFSRWTFASSQVLASNVDMRKETNVALELEQGTFGNNISWSFVQTHNQYPKGYRDLNKICCDLWRGIIVVRICRPIKAKPHRNGNKLNSHSTIDLRMFRTIITTWSAASSQPQIPSWWG